MSTPFPVAITCGDTTSLGLSHDPEFPCRGACSLSTSTIGGDHERLRAAQRCVSEQICARSLAVGDEELALSESLGVTLTDLLAAHKAFPGRRQEYLHCRSLPAASHEDALSYLRRYRDTRSRFSALSWRQFKDLPSVGGFPARVELLWPESSANLVQGVRDEAVFLSDDEPCDFAAPQRYRPPVDLPEVPSEFDETSFQITAERQRAGKGKPGRPCKYPTLYE